MLVQKVNSQHSETYKMQITRTKKQHDHTKTFSKTILLGNILENP